MDQPSRLGRWTCPIRHANSLGASIKDIYLVETERAQFERIMFVAFDGYTGKYTVYI